MKKVLFIMAICTAMVACKNGKTTSNATSSDSTAKDSTLTAADSVVFEGMTPAADCAGVKYHLSLATDSTNGFSATESYMEIDTKAKSTKNYHGKYDVVKKKVNGKENTYYTFELGKGNKVNFLVSNDSTLRMVNADFEEAVATKGLSYDLKMKK